MRLVFLIFTLTLSGCSTLPPQPTLNSLQQKHAWQEHQNTLKKISQWQLSGRFGAQNDTDSWHGRITWTQKNNHFDITISGPLSTGSLSLSGDDTQSTLILSNNQIIKASDPEALLEAHTGLQLPIKSLRYWLIGSLSPTDKPTNSSLNIHGQLAQLTQKGWDISFKKYREINNISLPKKIFLENHEYNVRLVIKNWEILPS